MGTVITVAMQKGGTGKSTTSLALAALFGKMGKVLLIDLDAQGNATYASGVDTPQRTIFDVLAEDCTAEDALIQCKYYDILASSKLLANVEMAEAAPMLLKDAIASVVDRYNVIIIDTPPALGNLSVNAMAASDYVIIPTDLRPFALQGLVTLQETIESIKNRINKRLEVLGILMVKFNDRTILNRDVIQMIKEFAEKMGTSVFQSTIREGIAVAESQISREPLIDYAAKSNPCMDYQALALEIVHKAKIIGVEEELWQKQKDLQKTAL